MTRFLAALVFTTRVMAQSAAPVEITAEPSHHLVMTTGRVRVFDVHVAPHRTTLIHAHHSDYLFITLGDADVTSARVGDTAVRLILHDGETRYAMGQFAHSAANNSDREFHNTTIELLHPASHVVLCSTACNVTLPCAVNTACPTATRQLASDQWAVELVTVPPGGRLAIGDPHGATLAVAVSDVRLTMDNGSMVGPPGTLSWLHTAVNAGPAPARAVLVEFKPSSSGAQASHAVDHVEGYRAMSMKDDLAHRSQDIHWPPGFEPEKADLFAHNELIINASCERVWTHIVDANRWPTWYPNSKDVEIQGGDSVLRDGTVFRWTTFGLAIESKVHEYVLNHRLGWYGYAPGAKPSFYHSWYLEPAGGMCHVVMDEAGVGKDAAGLRKSDETLMHRGHDLWLATLKWVAEAK